MSTNRIEHESTDATTLVKEIVSDLETLAKQHIRLFKHDIKEDVQRLQEGATSLAISLGILLIGGVLLGITLAELLVAVTEMPTWSAYAIVAALVCIAGGVLLYLGYERAKSAMPIADKTREALEEDVQWLKNPK